MTTGSPIDTQLEVSTGVDISMSALSNRQVIAAFVPLGGGASIAIRFSYGELVPYLSGVLRFALAVAGIAVALSGSLRSGVEVSLPHNAAIFVGAACFAEVGIVVELYPRSHPLATNAVGMTFGSLMLLVASVLTGESWDLASSAQVWLALVHIVLGATAAVLLLYLFVFGRWTALGTTYSFVLVTIVTVVLAAFLTDDTSSLIFLAGAALVLLGVLNWSPEATVNRVINCPRLRHSEPRIATLSVKKSQVSLAVSPHISCRV